jgi:hypothetical protein
MAAFEDFHNKYTTEYNQILIKVLQAMEDTGSLLPDDIAPFGGCMYETYGEEYEYLKKQPNKRIWTIIDEEDELYVIAGLHFVNRMGYLVTDEEWVDENETYLVD